jgi:hypothetical protein
MNLKNIKWIFCLVLFVLCGQTAQAQKNKSKDQKMVTNVEDLIQKSQNLILQKDRAQAIMILVRALNQASSKKEVIELKRNLEDISSLFLSDKTQQMYEAVLSNKRKDINTSLQKMLEISRVEPDQNLISAEAARLHILKKDCQQAFDLMEAQLKKNPYDELYLLTAAQAAACLGSKPELEKIEALSDNKKNNYRQDWLFLEMEKFYNENNKLKVKEKLAEIKKIDSENPQILYWESKAESDQKNTSSSLYEKYIQECKNLTSPRFRKYINNPHLCALQKEQL